MDCRRVKLKQYAARIKQVLVKEVNDVSSNVSFNAEVSILPTVEETESPSLKVSNQIIFTVHIINCLLNIYYR